MKKIITTFIVCALSTICHASPSEKAENLYPRVTKKIQSADDLRLTIGERAATHMALTICNDILSRDWRNPESTYLSLLEKYRDYKPGHPATLGNDLDEGLPTPASLIKANTQKIYYAKSCQPSEVESLSENDTMVKICYLGYNGGYDYVSHREFTPSSALTAQSCSSVYFSLVRSSKNGPWHLQLATSSLTPHKIK